MTPSSTCVRSLRCDALDQFLDRGRLVALRLVFGLDLEAHAAFGFLQARRPVRRPDLDLAVLALEFGAAVADQIFQRVGGGLDAERFHLVARRPCQRLVIVLRGRRGRAAAPVPDRASGSSPTCRSWPAGLPRGPASMRRASRHPRWFRCVERPRAMRRGLAAGAAVLNELSGGRPQARCLSPLPASPRLIAGFGSSASAGRRSATNVRPRDALESWRLGFGGFA